MALRFANALFEPVWRAAHIDHVQISVLETVGIGSRGDYYDQAGAIRDMLQKKINYCEKEKTAKSTLPSFLCQHYPHFNNDQWIARLERIL